MVCLAALNPPCSSPILPIELISFTALCDKQNVILKWSTATETNNLYYSVERSNEGINWQVAGTVAGAGNSFSQQTYTFRDIQVANKAFFYRLKQTDIDRNYKYGNILYVKNCTKEANNLSIYPNPSNGKFELLITGNTGQVHSIEIFNLQGQKLYESAGVQLKFDLSNQVPGIYFMRVQQNSKNHNLKFVIEK